MQNPFKEQTQQVSSPEGAEPEVSSLLGLLSQPPAMEASAGTIIDELALVKPTSVERAAISSALLGLLSDRAFGRIKVNDRVLRHEVVEAVLRLGYPSALQLEPSDVAALRVSAPRLGRLRTIHAVAFAVAALVGAVAGASVVVKAPSVEPAVMKPVVMETAAPTRAENDDDPPHAGIDCVHDDSHFAVPIAHRVAELRQAGQLVEALAVAEGCVVGSKRPRPASRNSSFFPPSRATPIARCTAADSGCCWLASPAPWCARGRATS